MFLQGRPEVIPLTPMSPRLISPLVVEIIGLPVNSNEVNLKAAPEVSIEASNPLSVSKGEVDPKTKAEAGPSIAGPR